MGLLYLLVFNMCVGSIYVVVCSCIPLVSVCVLLINLYPVFSISIYILERKKYLQVFRYST